MTLSTLTIRDTLLAKQTRTFSTREFRDLFSLSDRKALYYLESGVEKGLFTQLKRGLYCLKTDPPPELEIANQLYRPSYVSFEYALGYYNLLPEMVYVITSATTKPTREFSVENRTFSYTTIKTIAYTGYELKVDNNGRFLMAEPEKAVVDYLYTVSLGRRALSERLDLSNVNVDKVIKYAGLFSGKSLNKLITKLFNVKMYA